jgi:amino acid transporter
MRDRSIPPPSVNADDPSEDAILQAQGVTPVLSRRLNRFAAVAGPFNVISVPTGIAATMSLALNSGGPSGWFWSWLGVSIFTMFVGICLSELASAYPTAAALYQWTALLAKPSRAKRDSHRIGWLNFLGLAGGVGSVCYASAVSAQFLITLLHPAYTATPDRTMLFAVGVLLFSGCVNSLNIGAVARVNKAAAWWIMGGIAVIVVALAVVPTHHQSPGWVFGHTVNETGFGHWWGAPFGICLAGGSALYTFCGYDLAAHSSEETLSASRTVPTAITRAIGVSAICGLFLIAAIGFGVQNFAKESTAASPIAQLFQDALGSGWAKDLMAVVFGAQLLCSVAVTTAASRQWYAFSGRNGGMVGSKLWAYVSPRSRVPLGAVWFSIVFGGLLILPGLWNTTVLNAVVSINFVGLLTAYMGPIYLRLRRPERFTPGPWHRKHSLVYARIALVWTVVGTLIGIAPQVSPITLHNFNYAGPALLAILVLEEIMWLWRGRAYQPPAAMGADEAADLARDVV